MKKNDMRRAYYDSAKDLIAGTASLGDIERRRLSVDAPVLAVGKVAELTNIHPQTLRQYDRLGLIVPRRTPGGARRYSLRDVRLIAQTQYMSQYEAINIAGIARVLRLMEENRQLKRQIRRMQEPQGSSVFAARSDGEVVEFLRALVAQRGAEPSKSVAEDVSAAVAGSLDNGADGWRRELYSQRLEITAR